MLAEIAKFLFEIEILKDIPRTGYHFLGGIRQSVAEHSFGITMIAYCLAKMEPAVDELKLIKLCLLHDVVEARTGDLNYVHKKYVTANETQAIHDQARPLSFGEEYRRLTHEFNAGESQEARLARDADQLELLLNLKKCLDTGNPRAQAWIEFALKRLKTESGRKLGAQIARTASDAWWFIEDDHWWTEGKKRCDSDAT